MTAAAGRLPWFLMLAACWATFLVTGSGMIRSPFLLEMARDLDASLAATANLFSLTALAWGVASLCAGAASDRLGRLPLLLLAHGLMIAGIAGIALSASYGGVAAWTVVAGAGGGGHMGVIFAALSDRVHDGQRGRAMGWVITGQSLAFVAGLPIATWMGTLMDWRGVMLWVAAADLVAVVALWRALARPATAVASPVPPPPRTGLAGALPRPARLGPHLTHLLAAGVAERVCFGVVAVYFATLLQLRYGLDLGALTLPLGLMAAGNLAGNWIGAWIADNLPDRERSFALSSLGTAVLALAVFGWDPGLAASVAAGFFYALVNAIGRPALMAVLGQAPAETRGALLGFNITCASVGWITAAAAGGVLIEAYGPGALALPTAAIALLGAWLAARARRLAPPPSARA
jgi:predicted MFS family arabinose efflux permease